MCQSKVISDLTLSSDFMSSMHNQSNDGRQFGDGRNQNFPYLGHHFQKYPRAKCIRRKRTALPKSVTLSKFFFWAPVYIPSKVFPNLVLL